MDSQTTTVKSSPNMIVWATILVLLAVILSAVVTWLVVENKNFKVSDAEKSAIKDEIMIEVRALLNEQKDENPSQICLEGSTDCNDTPSGTCLEGSTDCADNPATNPAAGQTCLEGTGDCNDTPELKE
jgi:hypothetical protein